MKGRIISSESPTHSGTKRNVTAPSLEDRIEVINLLRVLPPFIYSWNEEASLSSIFTR